MDNKLNVKWITFFLLIGVIIGFLISSIFNPFPVTYKVCDGSYNDCSEIAKFKDRQDCETTKQKWGWYCDKTNKSKIICEEKDSSFSTGYCK